MNDEIEYGSVHGTLTLPRLIALCGVCLVIWAGIITIGMYVWEIMA